MTIKTSRKIALPPDLIPDGYIGERFGVLLVFVKGDDQNQIDTKVEKIREFCKRIQETL